MSAGVSGVVVGHRREAFVRPGRAVDAELAIHLSATSWNSGLLKSGFSYAGFSRTGSSWKREVSAGGSFAAWFQSAAAFWSAAGC